MIRWNAYSTHDWAERFPGVLAWDTITGIYFISPRRRDWKTTSLFSPLPSATFQAISPFHPPTTLFSFGEQNSSQCLRQSSREWTFLSTNKSRETRLDRRAKAQGLESTADELPLHSQAGTVFPWSERQMCALTFSSRYVSSADKFQTLSLGRCFRWVQLGAIPVVGNLLVSPRAPTARLPPHSTTEYHHLWWVTTTL